MSGGVDSSVAAALLAERGWDVVGCFMRLGSPGETLEGLEPFDSAGVSCDPGKAKIGHQGCCSINDAADAREVAAHVGVPFYVCNFKRDFGRIIDYFVREYAEGRTPNPCVRCNDWLKFGKLHDYAHQIGAEFVASGHYARITPDHAGRAQLRRGVDTGKDQSYVLFGSTRERLERMLLPIGAFRKADVRAHAQALGLPVFDKPDSQEICFVPDQDYAGLIERRRPDLATPGEIRDTSGNTIGEHQGQHRFTIGQRRGIGVALGHPVYVVDKDPRTNTVTVGSREDVRATSLTASRTNWLASAPPPADWIPVRAQVRYNAPAVAAEMRAVQPDATETSTLEVRFAEPTRAVTPGQAVVLYDPADPDRVLGGAWIDAADR